MTRSRAARGRRSRLATALVLGAVGVGCGPVQPATPRVAAPAPAAGTTVATASPASPTPEGIAWSPLRPLRWADFRGAPDPAAAVTAVTGYAIAYHAECASGVLSVRVTTTFLPDRSWVKPDLLTRADDSRLALAHEQTHFDLSEVHVRKIRQRLRDVVDPCRATQAQFDALVQPFLDEDARVQRQYDAETRHGIDRSRQAEWDERVRRDLRALSRFAR